MPTVEQWNGRTAALVENQEDGSHVPVVKALDSGALAQAIPDAADGAQLAASWDNFSGVNTAIGDFVTAVSGLNGQFITAISGSPLTTGESFAVNTQKPVTQPCQLEVAGSFVRTGVSFATIALFANGPSGPDPVPASINIVSCYQSNAVQGAAYSAVAGTVMHIQLETPVPAVGANNAVFIGDWINTTGLVDNRLVYSNGCINYISPDRTVIAIAFSDEASNQSLAIPAITPTLGTAKVHFYNNLSGARDGFGLRLTGTTATSAAIVSIFGGDDNQVSGTLLGDHRVTIGSTAPTYVAGGNFGQYEIRATNRFLLEAAPSAALVLDKPEQSMSNWTARDFPRTSVKPSSGASLYPRFRLYKPISMSRPIAKIVSATKTGATTATVITEEPHKLVTGNWITVKGNRDVTNFPAVTTPVQVTVIDATTFTIVWGGVTTATGYGGSVIIANGGRDQPGIIGQAVVSVASRVAADGNWLDVIGSANWTLLNLGDYIDLHGVRAHLTGADLGLDGAWEVAHIATTLLVLRPVFNIAGTRVSPALGTLGLTNAGGTVILRPTIRSHDLSLRSWAETLMGIDGQGTLRADKAMPMNVLNAIQAIQSGVWNVTTVSVQGTPIAPATPYILNSAAGTNLALISTGTSGLHAFYATNTGAAAAIVKLYNKATAPVIGTDVPAMVLVVPAAVGGVPGVCTLPIGYQGFRFALGLGIAITGGAADADATAVAAGQVKVILSRTV